MPRAWNRLQDPNPTVREWPAAHCLFWDEAAARAELKSQAACGRLAAVDAEYTLREFDCGRLNMT